MPTPNTIHSRLREARAEFIGMYNKRKDNSLFNGLVAELPAPEGFFKVTALSSPGEMEDFTGTATVNGLDSASQTYTTTLRHYTLGIDKNLLMKSDAVARGQVSAEIRKMAGRVVADEDKKLTTLLETGESTGNLDGNAFFADALALPGSSVTIDNLRSGAWTDSAAEFRSAIHDARNAFMSMRNAGNDLYHSGKPATIVVMYPPAIEQFVMDAVRPDQLDGGYKFENMSIDLRPNAYLDDADDVYIFVAESDYKPLIIGRQEQPNLVSTAGMNDSYQILHNQDLFQVRAAYEVAFGAPFSAVKMKDA